MTGVCVDWKKEWAGRQDDMTTDEERETGSQKGVAHFTGTPSPPRGTPFFRLAKGGTDAQTPDDPTLPDRLWTIFPTYWTT